MRKTTACVILIFFLSLTLVSQLAAAAWPNIEKALDAWQGPKEVHILTAKEAPLDSSELLPLIETFLNHDFAVRTAARQSGSDQGLLVEIRHQQEQSLTVLMRASDQAVIALDKFANKAQADTAHASMTPPSPQPAPTADRQLSSIPLEGSPVALVWLDGTGETGGNLATLSAGGVSLYRLQGRRLQKLFSVDPPQTGLRPLSLSRGDIDDDGTLELSAVWAEDIQSVYDGTDSNILSQLLILKPQKLLPLGQLSGYVRLLATQGVVQQRGAYASFSGSISKLHNKNGQLLSGSTPPWAKRNIFDLTPWTADMGLAWIKPGKLSALVLTTGELASEGTLFEDFGAERGAEIAVRRENPEFLSGFGKEDKIFEDYIPLPPRLDRLKTGEIATIYRGRKPGNFIFGQAEGADRLTLLLRQKDGVAITYPFPPVNAFILDFSVIEGKTPVEAVLLINEKEDGSGQAFLLRQKQKR